MNLQKDERGKVMMARSFGILMKGPTMYTVYCCGDYAEIWWEGIERQMLLLTEKYRSEVFGVPRGGEGAAIVYTPDRKVADEMFLPPKLIKNRINPTGVYGQGHVLPLTENHLDIRAMLMRDNWKEESGRFLLKENYTPGQLYDGTMNGYEVYNFLTNDMVHMSKCRQRIKTKPSTLLIHEWQEETVRRYFGEDVQLIKFSENEFAALIGAIEEAEEEFL